MKQLKAGQSFWNKQRSIRLEGTILTEVEYTSNIAQLPWHYHENVLFYYHLRGRLDEVNRKKTVNCVPGTLLFHHWQDAHYDKNFSNDASFFHIEIENKWFDHHHVKASILEGSIHLENPILNPLFLKIHRETGINDSTTQLSVDGLLLQAIAEITRATSIERSGTPGWAKRVREILHDRVGDKITLECLSLETGIHPVHLSKEFPRYFGTSFGQYIRGLRVQKATRLLLHGNLSLADIAYQCGFSDQSHFIRCFRNALGVTPLVYKKSLVKG